MRSVEWRGGRYLRSASVDTSAWASRRFAGDRRFASFGPASAPSESSRSSAARTAELTVDGDPLGRVHVNLGEIDWVPFLRRATTSEAAAEGGGNAVFAGPGGTGSCGQREDWEPNAWAATGSTLDR
jgi:hypothetical protein